MGREPVAVSGAQPSQKENGSGRSATSVSRSSLDLQEHQPTGKPTLQMLCDLWTSVYDNGPASPNGHTDWVTLVGECERNDALNAC